MKIFLLAIYTLLLLLIYQPVKAQKVILLQKSGTSKRFFYGTGDKIMVRMGEPEFTVYGEITYIDDSVCEVNRDYTFQLSKVHEVIRIRHFLNASWKTLYVTAGVYFAGSLINRAINDEEPLIDNTIPIVCGSFIALGTAAYIFRLRHCKMEKNWHLKVLDYSIFKEKKEGEVLE
jgi:hypothetical protein